MTAFSAVMKRINTLYMWRIIAYGTTAIRSLQLPKSHLTYWAYRKTCPDTSDAVLPSWVLGSLTVCLNSPAIVESLSWFTVVGLLLNPSGCIPAVPCLPLLFPIAEFSNLPANGPRSGYSPIRLSGYGPLSLTFPANGPCRLFTLPAIYNYPVIYLAG